MTNVRRIEGHCPGENIGPLRRLFDPAGLGERLKPFVLFDYFSGGVSPDQPTEPHFHSGVGALHSYDIDYLSMHGDSGKQPVSAGSVQWFQTGAGLWHHGATLNSGHMTGFELQLALPPTHEDGPAEVIQVPANRVPVIAGGTRVLLGSLDGAASPLPTPLRANCFDVAVAPDKTWTFTPPPDHKVAWMFVYQGTVAVAGMIVEDELAVFERSSNPIVIRTEGQPARLFLATAAEHPYRLHTKNSSVHTNETSLQAALRTFERGALTTA